jgi:hypothetical protein
LHLGLLFLVQGLTQLNTLLLLVAAVVVTVAVWGVVVEQVVIVHL